MCTKTVWKIWNIILITLIVQKNSKKKKKILDKVKCLWYSNKADRESGGTDFENWTTKDEKYKEQLVNSKEK